MGSRRTEFEGQEQVYAAAERWVDCALRSDDSLFTPGTPIWTPERLGELHERFLNHPDESRDDFYVKLEAQLADSPPEVHQLMGEVAYVHFLIIWERAMGRATKRARIDRVLRMSPLPVAIPSDLDGGLGPGVAHPGTAFHRYRPFQVGFIIEFVEQWKELPQSERDRLLSDPWEFKKFIESGIWGTPSYRTSFIPRSALMQTRNHDAAARPQCSALLHLIFPDTFEGIVSAPHKKEIAEWGRQTFGVAPTNDLDRDLYQIRPHAEAKYRSNVTYYEREVYRLWRGGVTLPPTGDLANLAADLLLPVEFLEEIDDLLIDKGQAIFYGPPGTGKTYVARELAEHLAGESGSVETVQFHPSYAYEDFVQGYRPVKTDGGLSYELTDGPLLRAAKRAEEEEDASHYLVIDEINRGNLAKVFGELYFLLEYREEQGMRLQYSDKPFSLPDNLYIIGTMNTADRSIARVDLALRRRFYFVEFHPDEPPVKGLLARFLEGNDLRDMEWVASFVDDANKELGDHEAAIGPSYFMNPNLDEDMARRVWKHAIRPYIEERLQDERDDARSERLKKFDVLWRDASGDAPPAAAESPGEPPPDDGVDQTDDDAAN